jgi:hypothetical protein
MERSNTKKPCNKHVLQGFLIFPGEPNRKNVELFA